MQVKDPAVPVAGACGASVTRRAARGDASLAAVSARRAPLESGVRGGCQGTCWNTVCISSISLAAPSLAVTHAHLHHPSPGVTLNRGNGCVARLSLEGLCVFGQEEDKTHLNIVIFLHFSQVQAKLL